MAILSRERWVNNGMGSSWTVSTYMVSAASSMDHNLTLYDYLYDHEWQKIQGWVLQTTLSNLQMIIFPYHHVKLSDLLFETAYQDRPFRLSHDDVIKWKHFPRHWPFVRGIHRSPVNSPNKGQWRGALMFSLICARINSWVNNREAGDLRRHRVHYDVICNAQSTMSDWHNASIVKPIIQNTNHTIHLFILREHKPMAVQCASNFGGYSPHSLALLVRNISNFHLQILDELCCFTPENQKMCMYIIPHTRNFSWAETIFWRTRTFIYIGNGKKLTAGGIKRFSLFEIGMPFAKKRFHKFIQNSHPVARVGNNPVNAWWRHQIEIYSALLDFCEGNPPVTGGFPSQRPVTRSFNVFFDLRLNKWRSKQSRRRWFETSL